MRVVVGDGVYAGCVVTVVLLRYRMHLYRSLSHFQIYLFQTPAPVSARVCIYFVVLR